MASFPGPGPEIMFQLTRGYAQDPQGTAIRALALTPEDFALTSNIAYDPPPEVLAIQTRMCSSTMGSLGSYFYHASHYVHEEARDVRTEIERGNTEIVEATRAFPASRDLNERIYTFSSRTLDQLLPVAKRGQDLLLGDPASTTDAYIELRNAVTTFIQHFKLPTLFCDALGFALETTPPILKNSVSLPRVVVTAPGPENPVVYPFVYDEGIVKEIVGVFSRERGLSFEAQGLVQLLILKSASRNTNHLDLPVFDLVSHNKFPGVMAECLQDPEGIHLFTHAGRIDEWRGKTWADFRIKGVASAPPQYGYQLTYILADSVDGEIGVQWWLETECNKKFGYVLPPAIFTHRLKTGQITAEEDHAIARSLQSGMVYQEREGDY